MKPRDQAAALLLLLTLAAAAGGCRTPGGAPAGGFAAVRLRQETRSTPRPLRIHAVRFDLTSPDFELAVAVATPDPDGDGPAQTRLRSPELTVSNAHFVAAVNANTFGTLPASEPSTPLLWLADLPVRICGAAVADGVVRSPPNRQAATFWLDARGTPHIATTNALPPDAWQAVAGFRELLLNGRTIAKTDAVLHPRTAVGYDRRGRYLWLVVVDGRQPGVSEGMTLHELAELMRRYGCHEALNLDGGGSSALFATRDEGGSPQLINRPSQLLTRPVPVLLGIRPRHTRP